MICIEKCTPSGVEYCRGLPLPCTEYWYHFIQTPENGDLWIDWSAKCCKHHKNPQCYNQISTLWNVHKTDHSKRKDIGGFFLYLTNHLLLTCCRNFIFFKTCWNIQMGSNLFKECSAKRISILIHHNQHILEVFYNCE